MSHHLFNVQLLILRVAQSLSRGRTPHKHTHTHAIREVDHPASCAESVRDGPNYETASLSRCTHLPAAQSLSVGAGRGESDKLINQNNRVSPAQNKQKSIFYPLRVCFQNKKHGTHKRLSTYPSDRYLAFPRIRPNERT